MYKIYADSEIIACFDTVLEAIAYCECFDYVKLNPNGTFTPLRIG